MPILAVESSTLVASVAVLVDGEIAIERESGVNTHSEVLLGLIDECLAHCQLTLRDLSTVAIGAGPGSFTGLRIGMATVKGLCFATGVPMTPVSSLAALALDARPHARPGEILVPVLDARRSEIFAGFYEQGEGNVISRGEELVLAPSDLAAALERFAGSELLLAGDGALKYESVLAPLGRLVSEARPTPSASAVARLAQHLPASEFLSSVAPTYVRLPEAEIKFPNGNPGGTFSKK